MAGAGARAGHGHVGRDAGGDAEAAANGKSVSEETIEAFGKAALEDVNPRTSWRATKELRIQLVEELAKRALRECIRLAGGTL